MMVFESEAAFEGAAYVPALDLRRHNGGMDILGGNEARGRWSPRWPGKT